MDLAFVLMDLHAHDRPDLAAALAGAYRDAGGDPGDDRLLAFFAAYRAQVRAKVALLRAAQLSATAAAAARADAGRLLALADRLAWIARGPVVLAVAGAAATGKTTLAAALAASSGLGHISSDVVRKEPVGLEPTARAPQCATARLADPARVSDATPAIALRQLGDFEPLDEISPGAHVAVRTDRAVAVLVTEVADALDRAASPQP